MTREDRVLLWLVAIIGATVVCVRAVMAIHDSYQTSELLNKGYEQFMTDSGKVLWGKRDEQ